MSERRALTIVLPCFNEGHRIAATLRTLDSWFGAGADVLVVDDGSGDATAAEAERVAASRPAIGIAIHRIGHNAGKGAALRRAFPLATGLNVVLMDADLAYDRDSVQRAVDALADADVAVGNRRHPMSRYSVPVRMFGFLYRRHLVGMSFNAFVRTLLPIALRDTQCGLKAFRRDALLRMAPSLSAAGFALDVEMLLVARALGLRLTDVPVSVTYESARSSVKLMRSGWSMARDVIRMAAAQASGRYSADRVRASASTAAPTPEAPTHKAPGR